MLRTRNCNLQAGGANGELEAMRQHGQNYILEKYMMTLYIEDDKTRVWETGWKKLTFEEGDG